jgi:F-type H+-transporting ATPase subunit delta
MSRRIARPYATALYQVLQKQGVGALRGGEADLGTVAAVFAATPALNRVFEVPTVSPADKKRLIASITTAADARVEVARLLAVMTEHLRLRHLPDVVATYRDLLDREAGVTRGRLLTPAPLAPGQVATLSQALSAALGGTVTLEAEVRPELLAGFVVRVGSLVLDGSIDAQLRRFTTEAATK